MAWGRARREKHTSQPENVSEIDEGGRWLTVGQGGTGRRLTPRVGRFAWADGFLLRRRAGHGPEGLTQATQRQGNLPFTLEDGREQVPCTCEAA